MSPQTGVSYEVLTQHWLADLQDGVKSAHTLELLTEQSGSRQEAIAFMVEVSAAGHFEGTRGQATHQLAQWNHYLRRVCSSRYERLAGIGASTAERQAANSDPILYDLNGIRKGVQRALSREHGYTRKHKKFMSRMRNPQTVIDEGFFKVII